MKKLVVVLSIFLIVSASGLAFAQSNEEDEYFMVMDAVIGRPLGLASIILGGTIFVISLPFTALSGSTAKAAKVLVINPVNYTFKRPLGDFDYKKNSYKKK